MDVEDSDKSSEHLKYVFIDPKKINDLSLEDILYYYCFIALKIDGSAHQNQDIEMLDFDADDDDLLEERVKIPMVDTRSSSYMEQH